MPARVARRTRKAPPAGPHNQVSSAPAGNPPARRPRPLAARAARQRQPRRFFFDYKVRSRGCTPQKTLDESSDEHLLILGYLAEVCIAASKELPKPDLNPLEYRRYLKQRRDDIPLHRIGRDFNLVKDL